MMVWKFSAHQLRLWGCAHVYIIGGVSLLSLSVAAKPTQGDFFPHIFLVIIASRLTGVLCRTYSVFLVISFESQIRRSAKQLLASSQKVPSPSRRVRDARKSAFKCIHCCFCSSPQQANSTILVNLEQKISVHTLKFFNPPSTPQGDFQAKSLNLREFKTTSNGGNHSHSHHFPFLKPTNSVIPYQDFVQSVCKNVVYYSFCT